MKLKGKVFLITGGASGLGAATGVHFAQHGARIVVADIDEKGGRGTAAAITDTGGEAVFTATDVTDEESVHGAVGTALDEFGALHGAVNCAGIAVAERVLGRSGPHDLGRYRRVIDINLIGTFNVVLAAAQVMAAADPYDDEGERGVIINTASVAAFDGQIGQAAYSASKGGVAAMTLPLARDLARHGIRVMTIAPGIMDTPMMAGLPEAARESLGKQVPFPSRLGLPEEYALLARHIVENPLLNGETIRLDGALRMGPR